MLGELHGHRANRLRMLAAKRANDLGISSVGAFYSGSGVFGYRTGHKAHVNGPGPAPPSESGVRIAGFPDVADACLSAAHFEALGEEQ